MEVLSDILRAMRVEGSVYFCDLLDPPWSKEFTDTTSAAFHLVRQGRCRVTAGEFDEILEEGDLVFLGPGLDHVLASRPPDLSARDPEPSTMLLCGYCDFDEDTATPLLEIFPEFAIVRCEELDRHPWLRGTFNQLSSEYLEQGPGADLIVNRLTEVVLIELIRINFDRRGASGFVRALNDQQVSQALQLMHQDPAGDWTLQSLADRVGLSRAAFAKRFTSLVGEPMFAYLTELRMQRAKELLRDTGMPVEDVAWRTGYESSLAFTRTFKKHTGRTPRQYRLS